MNFSALISAAYVEVQRTTGIKPDVRARVNRLLRRPVEGDFRALSRFRMPIGAVCVDAGANRGESIAAVRLSLPDAPIVAFEPNPLLVDLIRAKHSRDTQLIIHNMGLGDHGGQFDLYVPYYKGVPFDGLASFHREEAAGWLLRERLVGFDARHQEIRQFSCHVATLDGFGLTPAFLKIDVQGFEAAVVAGGRRTIARHKPVILMENNDPSRDAAGLIALGYEAHAYESGRLVRGGTGALNTWYIHPETRHLFDAEIYVG